MNSMRKELLTVRSAVLVVVIACLAGTHAKVRAEPRAPVGVDRAAVGRQADGTVVVPTNQVLTPAGLQVEFPGRPTDLALNPAGSVLAVMDATALVLIRVSDRVILQTLPLPNGAFAFAGITWAPDASAIYASGTRGVIRVAKITDGVATLVPPITLPSGTRAERGSFAAPGGLALSPDGATLYVCLNRLNTLGVVDVKRGQLVTQIPVGVAPYGVVIAGDRAYVSNWGGRRAAGGDVTADSSGTPVIVNPANGVATSGTVSVVDLAQNKEIATIAVGLHPCGLALSRDGRRLYVANANSDTVSVVNTANNAVMETISVSPAEGLPFGSAPNALALSPDERTLYVADGGNNAVAVVRLGGTANGGGSSAPSRVDGFIPTGWYPGSVLVSADGKLLFVANVKGVGSLSTPTSRAARKLSTGYARDASAHHVYDARGSVSIIPVPGAAALRSYTERVGVNNGLSFGLAALERGARSNQRVPVPLRKGQRSVFDHVIYIIKENRTYDQVFGDMPEGNGDPSLVQFGAEVTPNLHRLAREFVLFDNLYASGVCSADGHQWTDEAYVTDYVEKMYTGFERSYPSHGGDPLAYASSGFLWDNALSHHLTFRDYGEFASARIEPEGLSWASMYADYLALSAPGSTAQPEVQIHAVTTVDSLRPYLCPRFAGFLLPPDVYRAHEFIAELHQFEGKGELPNLMMVWLPNDHTAGMVPGMPTPRAMVADNDLAVGQVIEAISHSRFWPTTCIFVIEDDAQDGLDHVDGHRTVGLCVSPYTRRHVVDSTNYNQVSIVRTIELILGLPPMNQFDLSATPMASCFVGKPDFTPYRATPNRIPLNEMNPPLTALSGAQRYWALQSLAQPLEHADEADEDTMNRILWHSVKGCNTPYPQLASRRTP
jgi:YVTN family beta-propeller protein